jgi:endonuclease/exonuclease/phosphatase family metal-dependent hydrolase
MPRPPDFAADIVPRLTAGAVRIAAFNCENLFNRAVAMNYPDNAHGQPYLDAFHELNTIFAKDVYSAQDKARILALMGRYKLTGTRPKSKHFEFRKIRGQLFGTQGKKRVVVANGRADWQGWLELKEEAIDDTAITNTARVIAAVDADIQVLVEIEHRPALVDFHDGVLRPILERTGRVGYPYALLVDGNDPRGIDVAILSRFPITDISTHVFDVPGAPPIFARDCCEYFIELPGLASRLIVMANHFTSKGSDPKGLARRLPQARRVASIVDQRKQQGFSHFVVCGDLNDTPTAASLQPVVTHPELQDAIARFAQSIDPTGKRLGTYETGKAQLDYLLLSPALQAAAVSAGIERRGTYAPRTWEPFETVTGERTQASDHHCIWVDLTL